MIQRHGWTEFYSGLDLMFKECKLSVVWLYQKGIACQIEQKAIVDTQ